MLFFNKNKRRKAEVALSKGGVDSISYWAIVKKQFQKNTLAKWALRVLMLLVFIAVFGDFLANDKPIYCKINQQSHFPVFKSYAVDMGLAKWPAELVNVDWKDLEYEQKILPLIPYSPTDLDLRNAHFKSPFDKQNVKGMRYWHWLGTDELGRDVGSGLIHGTRVALLVGILAMGVAVLIGLFFGVLAGFFGDNGFKVSRIRLLLNLIGLPLSWLLAFSARKYQIMETGNFGIEIIKSIFFFSLILFGINLIARLVERFSFFKKRVSIPLDLGIMRFIEMLNSIPGLLILIVVLAILEQTSLVYLMVIIGFISWTGIARFIRAELLRIRSLEYVEAAQALGYPRLRIIFKHAIPNALPPVLITIAFGIAAAILAEATLSFLGIGIPLEKVTWGSLLTEARKNASAWWLALFPGIAIFVTVTVFNLIGDGLTEALDPKMREQ